MRNRTALVLSAMTFALAAPGLAACEPRTHGPVAPREDLQNRVAFEMNCPAESLAWTRFERTEWGVEGCGHRRTYLEVCSGVGLAQTCHWVANGGN